MVFFGEYHVSFTGKGRIVLPSRLREVLKEKIFVITKGFDMCLACYDKLDWENRTQSLMNISLLEKDQIEKRRMLFSSAVFIEIDEQGRFVVPKELIKKLGEDIKKAVIIGVGDHFEIWEEEKWGKYSSEITI